MRKVPKQVRWGEYEDWMELKITQEQIVLPQIVENLIVQNFPNETTAHRLSAIWQSQFLTPSEWRTLMELRVAQEKVLPGTNNLLAVLIGETETWRENLEWINILRMRAGKPLMPLKVNDSQMTQFYPPWSEKVLQTPLSEIEEMEKLVRRFQKRYSTARLSDLLFSMLLRQTRLLRDLTALEQSK